MDPSSLNSDDHLAGSLSPFGGKSNFDIDKMFNSHQLGSTLFTKDAIDIEQDQQIWQQEPNQSMHGSSIYHEVELTKSTERSSSPPFASSKKKKVEPHDNLDSMKEPPSKGYFDSILWKSKMEQTQLDDVSKRILGDSSELEQGKSEMSQVLDESFFNLDQREPNDSLFARFYIMNMVIMTLIGITNVLVSEGSIQVLFPVAFAYQTMIQASTLFFVSVMISIGIAMLWTFILYQYGAVLIWSSLLFLPIGAFSCFLYSLYALFTLECTFGGTFFLSTLAISFLLGAIGFALYVRTYSDRVDTSVRVIKMTCGILKENKSLFWVSYGLLVVYFIFTGFWFVLYVHLLLLGHDDGDSWSLLPSSYFLQFYFLGMFIWTTAIFGNIQRCLIAGVVGPWYFVKRSGYLYLLDLGDHDYGKIGNDTSFDDAVLISRQKPSWKSNVHSILLSEIQDMQSNLSLSIYSLQLAIKRTFGQICFGGLVLYSVRILNAVASLLKGFFSYTTPLPNRPLYGFSIISSFSLGIIRLADRLLQRFTYSCMTYSTFTGASFLSSGRAVASLMTRQFGTFISADILSRSIFTLSSLIVSLFISLLIYVFDLHHLASQYTIFSASLFGLLSYGCLSFASGILTDTLDVAFVCYMLDLDNDQRLNDQVHSAFEGLFQQ